jgi:hypothetical protein
MGPRGQLSIPIKAAAIRQAATSPMNSSSGSIPHLPSPQRRRPSAMMMPAPK